jgi:hypothetical protein
MNLKITTDKQIDLLEKSLDEKDQFIDKFGSLKQSQQLEANFYKRFSSAKVLNSRESSNVVYLMDRHFIDEQQQKIKEILKNSISSKQDVLERSKLKQIQNINTLKSKLNDVEQMNESYTTSFKSV